MGLKEVSTRVIEGSEWVDGEKRRWWDFDGLFNFCNVSHVLKNSGPSDMVQD